MLRKLFIGLLILSALTSKGAGSEISGSAERFSPGNLSSLSGVKWFSDGEVSDNREINLTKSVSAFRGSALISSGEFFRVKSLEQHIYSSIEDSTTCKHRESFQYCTKPVLSTYSRNSDSCATDVSPPAL